MPSKKAYSPADPKGAILLRTSDSSGHGGIGAGVKDMISLETDVDAFFPRQLGVPLAGKRYRFLWEHAVAGSIPAAPTTSPSPPAGRENTFRKQGQSL